MFNRRLNAYDVTINRSVSPARFHSGHSCKVCNQICKLVAPWSPCLPLINYIINKQKQYFVLRVGLVRPELQFAARRKLKNLVRHVQDQNCNCVLQRMEVQGEPVRPVKQSIIYLFIYYLIVDLMRNKPTNLVTNLATVPRVEASWGHTPE